MNRWIRWLPWGLLLISVVGLGAILSQHLAVATQRHTTQERISITLAEALDTLGQFSTMAEQVAATGTITETRVALERLRRHTYTVGQLFAIYDTTLVGRATRPDMHAIVATYGFEIVDLEVVLGTAPSLDPQQQARLQLLAADLRRLHERFPAEVLQQNDPAAFAAAATQFCDASQLPVVEPDLPFCR